MDIRAPISISEIVYAKHSIYKISRVVAIFNLFLFYFKSVLIQQFSIGNKVKNISKAEGIYR